tara:strand:+ start:281 stop:1657 length:1377 start_codon:yes stop_codon:yes gene_type:complete
MKDDKDPITSEKATALAEMYREAAENLTTVEALQEKNEKDLENMKIELSWLTNQPLSNHFDLTKEYARENKISLTDAKKALHYNVKKYEIEGKDIPSLIKELKIHRRTLKGDPKIQFTNSIENLIDAYSDHLDKSIDNIYWVRKYKPLIREMTCNEDTLVKLSKIEDEDTRRDIVDSLCKYWEAKIDRKELGFKKGYGQIAKDMTSAKKEFKSVIKKHNGSFKNWSEKETIKKHILYEVCDNQGITVRQVYERLPNKLIKKTTTSMISKMAVSQNITNVNGALYKFSDDIKKDIYSYTAAFIDSDGYITMDKNFNPRVGLIATGDRGKAFMLEMHKSLGGGRLHLDQKSPQGTRPVQRLNFYSMDDVHDILTKCRPHFKMKGANADILLELIRMKKSHKKTDWYESRRKELFQLMKYENHKDHVGYDFSQYGIDPTTVVKFHDNSKMFEMDKLEGVVA